MLEFILAEINSPKMNLGTTVEGFPIVPGSHYWIPIEVEIEQPILRKDSPTEANPSAVSDKRLPPKKVITPKKIVVNSKPEQPVWQRYTDCHTHCLQLNGVGHV